MSYNCPCLVSDIAENIELVQEYGQTFKVTDEADLKEKMMKLLLTGPRKIDTRSYVEEKYNWENVVERTLEIYKG